MRVVGGRNGRIDDARLTTTRRALGVAVVGERLPAPPSEVYKADLPTRTRTWARVIPGRDAIRGLAPGHAMGTAAGVDVAADGEAGADAAQVTRERGAARGAAVLVGVAVGEGGGVGDDDVGVWGYVVPRGRGGRGAVVGEGPETAAPGGGVGRAEYAEPGAGAGRGAERHGGGGVVEVGDGRGGGEEGEAAGVGLGVLVVVESGPVLRVEGFVQGDVVVPLEMVSGR